jgi:hypothetical protein
MGKYFLQLLDGEQMSSPGLLKVFRKSNLAAGLRKFDLLVDGNKIGNIGNGKQESYEVASGRHTVQVKLGLGSRSEMLDIEVNPNSSLELECGISPTFWVRNLLFFAILVGLMIFKTNIAHDVFVAMVLVLGIVSLLANYKPGATYYIKRAG